MSESEHFLRNAQSAIAEGFYNTSEKIENLCRGTSCSATCMLIRERELYIGWVGDSHAVLSRDTKAVVLTHGEFNPDYSLGNLHRAGRPLVVVMRLHLLTCDNVADSQARNRIYSVRSSGSLISSSS